MYVLTREAVGQAPNSNTGGLWRSYLLTGAPRPTGNLAYAPGMGEVAPSTLIEPVPVPADYVAVAKEILKKHTKRGRGIVMTLVEIVSAGGSELIDDRTEPGQRRPVLKNPPAHLVRPPEVYGIDWRKKGWRRALRFQYVWILSNEKSTFPVGGVLFLAPGTGRLGASYFVTFNVGALDDRNCTNVHHAEMQALGNAPDRKGFLEAQPRAWLARLGAINVVNLSTRTGLGYSPCNYCCVDLARFLTDLRALQPAVKASMTWLTPYDRNARCGHPTTIENLKKLAAAGWKLQGPLWPGGAAPSAPSRPAPARPAPAGPSAGGLSATQLSTAVAQNQVLAARLGWDVLYGAIASWILRFRNMTPTPTAFAQSVASWQSRNTLPPTGIIDAATWQAMLRDAKAGIPRPFSTPERVPRPHGLRAIVATFGDPTQAGWERANIVTVNAPSGRVFSRGVTSLRVHRLLAPHWQRLFQAANAAGVWDELVPSAGTYLCRTKFQHGSRPCGTPGIAFNQLSTHSWGITIDIRPAQYPFHTADMHTRRVRPGVPPATILQVFQDHGFHAGLWFMQGGLDASGRINFTGADGMHFQYATGY